MHNKPEPLCPAVLSPKKKQKLQHTAADFDAGVLSTSYASEKAHASPQKEASAEEVCAVAQEGDESDQHKPTSDARVDVDSAHGAERQCTKDAQTVPQAHGQTGPTVHETFVDWYSSLCTTVFADGLSACHKSQDSSHAQPGLLLRCIKIHASSFTPQKQEIVIQQQKVARPQRQSSCSRVSSWL